MLQLNAFLVFIFSLFELFLCFFQCSFSTLFSCFFCHFKFQILFPFFLLFVPYHFASLPPSQLFFLVLGSLFRFLLIFSVPSLSSRSLARFYLARTVRALTCFPSISALTGCTSEANGVLSWSVNSFPARHTWKNFHNPLSSKPPNASFFPQIPAKTYGLQNAQKTSIIDGN